jgi:hypothetical protein
MWRLTMEGYPLWIFQMFGLILPRVLPTLIVSLDMQRRG